MLSSLSRSNKLVFFSLALWGVGEGLWWYLLPIYLGNLGADSVQIGFVLSIGMVLMTVSFIPSGWITDRFSRRLIMIIGWVLGFIAILVLAAAHTWEQAIPGLVLYNLSAFNSPALNSYVTAEVKPGQDMRRVYTTVFSGYTLGMLFSPAVGGLLADLLGIRSLFLLAAAAYGISAVLIFLIHDQPVHREAHSTAGSSLFSSRPFIYLCAVFFLAFLFCHLGIPLASNFLSDVRGISLAEIGVLGSVNSLGALLLTLGLGRWPRSRTSGMVLAELGVASYAFLLLTTSAFPLIALGFFSRGGLGALRQLGAARLGEMMPPQSMGLGFGFYSTVVNLAFTCSPYIAGWLYAANPFFPFVASLVGLVSVMPLTVLVGRLTRAPLETAA